MTNINKPMGISGLDPKPPINRQVRLSEDMQQTLAFLTAYGINERKVLKSSETGILSVASARIKDIKHYTYTAGKQNQVGDSVPCSEVMVMGHPDNTGLVWVRPDKTADADNAWPLSANDVVSFTVDNLEQLNMYFITLDDSVIVAYTR